MSLNKTRYQKWHFYVITYKKYRFTQYITNRKQDGEFMARDFTFFFIFTLTLKPTQP